MAKVIYSDRLVRITGKYIFFKRYYFPYGSKCIELSKIDYVEVLNSSMLNGQWRIHGSGDFRTWFPHDANRPKRDRIFVLHLHKGWRRIGFTVENSDALIDIFNNRNVPVRDKQPNNAISEVGAKTKA